jgi:hypothetical protein
MPELAAFQDAFARSLREPSTAAGPLADAPAMAVYRNTVAKGLVDVLRAAFPTVERLVGEEWFAAAAQAFTHRTPPQNPVLAEYGGGFPSFLAAFPPAAEIPYLADVAGIDRLWTEAHFASDAPHLAPATLAALGPETLAAGRLRLHASTRFAWFETPAPTIWRLNRPPAPAPGAEGFEIEWGAEGIALARPGGEVHAVGLGPGAFALLAACGRGLPFGEALSAAVSAEPSLALDACLSSLATAGMFGGFDPAPHEQETSS